MSTVQRLALGGLFLAGATALGLGCGRGHEQKAYAVPTPAEESPVQGLAPTKKETKPLGAETLVPLALNDIAGARCTHEQRCGQIGSTQRYPDEQTCVDRTKDRVRAWLNAKACPDGIDPDGLKACLDGLHSLSCSVDLDDVKACNAQSVCIRHGSKKSKESPRGRR